MRPSDQGEPGSRVSVIIPLYNGAPYLAEAIDSVLAQTRSPDEIIVVDDGSTDGSAEIAGAYGSLVRCLQQAHAGPAAARNTGVKQAHGDLLAFLDADDLWLPDKLERQVAVLAAAPYPDMVFGRVEQFCRPALAARLRFSDAGRVMNGLHVGAMLIRTAAFREVGPFHTDLQVGEFIDWYNRALAQSLTSHSLPQVVMRRRLHEHNLMRRAQDIGSDYLSILRKAVHRRRGQQ